MKTNCACPVREYRLLLFWWQYRHGPGELAASTATVRGKWLICFEHIPMESNESIPGQRSLFQKTVVARLLLRLSLI